MAYYKEELRSLKEKTLRKAHLENLIDDLVMQRADLEDKVYFLGISKNQEQKDADRLEGRSLTAFFYTVIGKKEEKLEKELQEARAAAVKYDAAERELAAVKADLERYEAEMRSLEGCEKELENAMTEAAAQAKASDTPEAEKIRLAEEEIIRLQNSLREHDEAVEAGDKAYKTVCAVLEKLGKAENWGAWDLFGGGILADIAKHEALDEAQNMIESLQVDLRRFKTELSDVELQYDIQVNIDGFLKFADFFFDGLFADFASLRRIEKSKEEIEKTKHNLENTLNSLIASQNSIDSSIAKLKAELQELLITES